MSNNSNSSKIQFGTDGWRGIIADDFTFANVRKVTRAIASYLETTYSKKYPVLIAYDTRFLADEFAYTAALVLAELGWMVKIAKQNCPTPAIAYNARYLDCAGALMFTASHIHAYYCGIKYISDYGEPATAEINEMIMAYIENATDTPPTGDITGDISSFDPKPEYLKFLYSQLDVERICHAQLKVKYDALYSTSGGYLNKVLEHCGCETETLHTTRDVLFGGGMPEPSGEQIADLVETVKLDKADLGLATDGDGDRFGIVDEKGNILSSNTVLILLARHLIKNKRKNGTLVRTVATTHLLDNLAARYDLEIYETPVGFEYIGEKMQQTDVLISEEKSGELSSLDYISEKDGILANMLVVEAIAYEGKPLSRIVAEAIQEAGGPVYNQRLDLHLEANQKTVVLEAFNQNPPKEIAGIKVKKVGHKDGVKLYLENGSWVLLHSSGTETLLSVYLEANSSELATQIAQAMERLIFRQEALAV